MAILRKIKRAIRGEVKPRTVVLEAWRRTRVARRAREERTSLDLINAEVPQLLLGTDKDVLAHFRARDKPNFFPGFSCNSIAQLQREHFPLETHELLEVARQIVDEHAWPLLGFGIKSFGRDIDWCRDPLSEYVWPLDYHRDIKLIRSDGSDARVLWEVNRMGHLLTLARAYAVTSDERFSDECLNQVQSWSQQNPYGRGVNWGCAMEVALRSMNLLAVFELLKRSAKFTNETMLLFLKLFHQHGTYIKNNLEFSYISTSNHYLSDVAGLLWLGTMLPEFCEAKSWQNFALAQLLSEMEKQVLPDGADFESSTGYHRFALELFLYSFLLCKENGIEIDTKYWDKLQAMLEYTRGYLRPDGLAPLIGDSDSGQVLPIYRRGAADHSYLLAFGAVVFQRSNFRMPGVDCPLELLWLCGEEGLKRFGSLGVSESVKSTGFPNAGTYVMREADRYLCLNTSGAGINGRGSHGHNDALSIEVSVGEHPFIVDPGTYLYTADLEQRHLFRSTAYHSTVKIDGEEQNSTIEAVPFVIGDEAQSRVLEWQTADRVDKVVAEHSGYARLPSPVIHRRTIVFHKREGYWLIEDEFLTEGSHDYEVRFHFAPALDVSVGPASATAAQPGMSLTVSLLNETGPPVLETQASSRDYGEKRTSVTACWRFSGKPGKLKWRISTL